MTLELRHVFKRVGAEVHIHETSVELKENEFNILLGTTLAGKTSLMQLMAGLERPTSGEIWFGGSNFTGVAVQKRNVSMVHQQFINYPNFSVFDNIASPLRVAGVPRADIAGRVERVAEMLRISSILDRRPNELSGGQQQRTALARALVKDADLVLLDEPLANLDYKLREEFRDELPRLFKGRGRTVVYATDKHRHRHQEGHQVRARRDRRLGGGRRPQGRAGWCLCHGHTAASRDSHADAIP